MNLFLPIRYKIVKHYAFSHFGGSIYEGSKYLSMHIVSKTTVHVQSTRTCLLPPICSRNTCMTLHQRSWRLWLGVPPLIVQGGHQTSIIDTSECVLGSIITNRRSPKANTIPAVHCTHKLTPNASVFRESRPGLHTARIADISENGKRISLPMQF